MKNANLQDVFLNAARKEHMPLTVFLVNGFQIKGNVRAFDSFTVLVETDQKQQLIYKSAISTIVPLRPVRYSEQAEEIVPPGMDEIPNP